MPEPLPPIDYSSRDWTALRSDLIQAKRDRMPEWKSESPNDFGIVLIELFAYMGDMLSFYIDRTANEAFLDTAVQRSSVYAIARMLDYRPTGQKAAALTVKFTTASDTGAVTIPARTRVQTVASPGDDPIVFETNSNLVIPGNTANPAVYNGTVGATEGVTIPDELVAVSDGTAEQQYPLFRSPVIDGSVLVEVAGVQWVHYDHLLDAGPNDTAYTTITDENGVTFVRFGDDVNGRIPPTGALLGVTYRIGSGAAGNVAVGTVRELTVPVLVNGAVQPVTGVTNETKGVGGADPESIDSIRINAPRSLATVNRAVTVADYAALALRVSGVGKARAVAGPGADEVTITIAPTSSPGGTATGRDEVQTVSITGAPTGGTFTLTFKGETTAAIAYNATAGTVATALVALPGIGAGEVVGSGGPLPATPVALRFTLGLGLQDVPAMTASGASLTGGTAPAVTVAETTKGVVGVKGAVMAYLEGRKMIGTTVTLTDPDYKKVDVTVTVEVLPTYRRSTVVDELSKNLSAVFSFDVVDFGTPISLSRIYRAISETEGVDYGTVTTLGAQGAGGTPAPAGVAANVVMAPGQIPTLGTVTVNATGGIV